MRLGIIDTAHEGKVAGFGLQCGLCLRPEAFGLLALGVGRGGELSLSFLPFIHTFLRGKEGRRVCRYIPIRLPFDEVPCYTCRWP